MPNDDFLKQFQQEPPDDFSESLLEKLHHIDSDHHTDTTTTPQKPLLAWPRFRWRQTPQNRASGSSWALVVALLIVSAVFGLVMIDFQANSTPPTAADTADLNQVVSINRSQSRPEIQQMVWSPDTGHLYVVGREKVRVLDAELQRVDSWSHGIDDPISAIAFDEWGYRLALGTTEGHIRVIQARSSQIVLQQNQLFERPMQHLAFIPGRQQVLAASDTQLALVTVQSQAFFRMRARTTVIEGPAEDMPAERDRPVINRENQVRIAGISLHPDGDEVLVTLSNSATLRYDLTDERILPRSEEDLLPASAQMLYSSTGDTLITVWQGALHLLDSNTYRERRQYALPDTSLFWLRPIQSSRTGQRLLLNNTRQSISVWDFQAADSVQLWSGERNDPHTPQAALSHDGQFVAVQETPRQIALWQILPYASGQVRAERIGSTQPFNTESDAVRATIAPNNRVSIRSDNALNAPVEAAYAFGDGYLKQALWSPDGQNLLVVGTTGLRVYDESLRLRYTWHVRRADITQAAYSPDSQFIATGSSDGSLTLWQPDGTLLTTLAAVHDSPVTQVYFLPGYTTPRLLSRAENGDFALLSFDGRNLDVINRETLAGYRVLDVHLSETQIQFVVQRITPDDAPRSVIQVLDMASDGTLQGSTTGVNGRYAHFITAGNTTTREQQVLVYGRESADIYSADSMTWQRSLASFGGMQLPFSEKPIMVSSAADRVVTGLQTGSGLYLSDLSSEQTVRMDVHLPTAVAMHPSGDSIALITAYNRVQLHRIQTNADDNTLSTSTRASDTPVSGRIQTLLADGGNLAAATTADGSLLLFDVVTGHLLLHLPLDTWGKPNHDLLFSPDKSLLLVMGQDASGRDTRLHLVNIQATLTGADDSFRVASATVEREVLSGMAFLDDERFLTGGSGGRVWQRVRDELRVATEADNLRGLSVFAASSEQDKLATVRPGNYLSLVTTSPLNAVYETSLTGRMLQTGIHLAFTPDDAHVVLGLKNREIRLYDVPSGLQIDTLTHNGAAIERFSDMAMRDELLLFSHEDRLYLWETDALPQTTDARRVQLDITPRQIALSGDNGARLLALAADGRVYVYDADGPNNRER